MVYRHDRDNCGQLCECRYVWCEGCERECHETDMDGSPPRCEECRAEFECEEEDDEE